MHRYPISLSLHHSCLSEYNYDGFLHNFVFVCHLLENKVEGWSHHEGLHVGRVIQGPGCIVSGSVFLYC